MFLHLFHLFHCGYAGVRPLVEQIEPRKILFKYSTSSTGLFLPNRWYYKYAKLPTSTEKPYWEGDKHKYMNTRPHTHMFIYIYIFDVRLSVSFH